MKEVTDLNIINYDNERKTDELYNTIKILCFSYIKEGIISSEITEYQLKAMSSLLIEKHENLSELHKSFNLDKRMDQTVELAKIIDSITLSNSITDCVIISNIARLKKEVNYQLENVSFLIVILDKIIAQYF